MPKYTSKLACALREDLSKYGQKLFSMVIEAEDRKEITKHRADICIKWLEAYFNRHSPSIFSGLLRIH